jgi:hypothetical protein
VLALLKSFAFAGSPGALRAALGSLLLLSLLGVATASPASAQRSCDTIFSEDTFFCVMPRMGAGDTPEYRQDIGRCCCTTGKEAACTKGAAKPPPAATSVSACPAAPGRDGAIALIAANYDSRAVATYHGSPNRQVAVWVDDGGVRQMRFDLAVPELNWTHPHLSSKYLYATRDKPLVAQTDSNGQLKVVFRARVVLDPPPPPINAPLAVRVVFREDGAVSDKSATVRLGLGVELVEARMVMVSPTLGEGPNHLWRAAVKSRWFPELDLADYEHGIAQCDPDLPRPRVNIQSIALGFDERGTLIDGIAGPGDEFAPDSDARLQIGALYGFGRDPKGVVYLKPIQFGEKLPYRMYGRDVYPGVTQLRDGVYPKGYFGLLRVQEPDGSWTYKQPSLEPRVIDHAIYTYRMDSAEQWYMSAVCAFDARTVNQMFMLQALSLVPEAGDGVELSVSAINALCKAARGDYVASLTELGYTLGKQGLGRLVKGRLLPIATQGKWSPKFYRLLGIDPSLMSKAESEAFVGALGKAYDTAITGLEAGNWKQPK